MRWWGWGCDAHAVELPEAAVALLHDRLAVEPGVRSGPVALDEVRLPEPRLTEKALARLEAAVGREQLSQGRLDRVLHAAGKGYPDLVRLRAGDASSAPDAVVAPVSAHQVKAVLAACADARMAVVPFGGGTSVVGGVEPLSDGFEGAVSLDLRRIDHLDRLDRLSLTAAFGAGLLGPELERRLAREGLTLGHLPQSWEYSTVGGWVATRSAGQASTGYGRIDELVEGLTLVAPAGELDGRAVPATAAGPDLRELAIGSEGVLGVICEATLRLRPLPAERRCEGWSFRSFAEGCEAFRVMEQADASPDVARLSDEEETALAMALGSSGRMAERLGRSYLRLRGHEGGCLAIVGFEGAEPEVERRRRRASELLRAGDGLRLGRRPGEAWLRSRFAGPYLRDELLDRGVMVETLETATTWSNLGKLYAAVGEALRGSLEGRGTPPIVMCHASHLYRSGASLYFTFLARQEAEDPLAQWRAAKAAASDAIMAAGGTITHHHAIGRDHAPWMRAEVGKLGLEVIRGAKDVLDPAGIMNPGKLLPG